MYHHHQCENHLCLLLLLRLFLSLIIMYELVQLVSLTNRTSACVIAKRRFDVQANIRLVYLQCNKWKRQLIFPLPFCQDFWSQVFVSLNQIWCEFISIILFIKTMYHQIKPFFQINLFRFVKNTLLSQLYNQIIL